MDSRHKLPIHGYHHAPEGGKSMTHDEHLAHMQRIRTANFRDRVDDLNALKQVFGDQVVEIVMAERAKKTERQWHAIAREHGRTDIHGLKDTLWTWVQEAGFEFTVTETAEGTQFHVTRCPLAEMAQELQATDLGVCVFLC